MAIDPEQQEPRLLWGEPMSVEDYLRLNLKSISIKYQYIDGRVYAMSGGSAAHDRISFNVRAAIDINFLSGPCTVFGSDMQVLVGRKPNGQPQYYYPDVTVSCDVSDRRRDNRLIVSPRIVVEVLSPSTEDIDRNTKLDAYKACPTIQEIILISQFAQHVEVYRRDEEDGTIWSDAVYGPSMEVELRSIDVDITIEEIYKGIDFTEPLEN
ncbi:MAG: Uma2 family endonuclease [Ktedonobacteraceae bacterium]|nr:Uma2 family endonuclease [Ktedonobacteraceae bacterium]MBO0790937.1 Uma2 family endonuclease [Ktedonobacteraceae bacterium]